MKIGGFSKLCPSSCQKCRERQNWYICNECDTPRPQLEPMQATVSTRVRSADGVSGPAQTHASRFDPTWAHHCHYVAAAPLFHVQAMALSRGDGRLATPDLKTAHREEKPTSSALASTPVLTSLRTGTLIW